MKTNTITSLEVQGICGPQPKYGNIEVEQSASHILRQAPQGHSNENAHPNISDDGSRTPRTWVGKESAAMKDEFSSGYVPKRVVEIDTAKYQKYLDDPALSDDQKEEIIEALWSIITAFVDLGFGVHPMQEVCGKDVQRLDHDGSTDSNDPKPAKTALQNAFNAASDDT